MEMEPKGSRSSVVRAPTVKVGGLGFDSLWLSGIFSVSVMPVAFPPVLTTSC